MSNTVESNVEFLRGLFGGSGEQYGLIVAPESINQPTEEDFTVSDRPLEEWIPWGVENYRRRLKFHEQLDDHSVPFVNLNTHTGVFASAFGCDVHQPAEGNPFALPCVSTAREAEKLQEPDLNVPIMERLFGFARLMREELGEDVYFGAPDLQSPLDIAGLIWEKDKLFPAMIQTPDAVMGLVRKCERYLMRFLDAFREEFPRCKLMHMNSAWAPADLGCALSVDEVGSISPAMFEKFCLPGLTRLSERYNGLFVHCCADAEHQHDSFLKVPKLRGMNRVMPEEREFKWIDDFSGDAVILAYYYGVDRMLKLLDRAHPDTRFLFVMHAQTLGEAGPMVEEMREAFRQKS